MRAFEASGSGWAAQMKKAAVIGVGNILKPELVERGGVASRVLVRPQGG